MAVLGHTWPSWKLRRAASPYTCNPFRAHSLGNSASPCYICALGATFNKVYGNITCKSKKLGRKIKLNIHRHENEKNTSIHTREWIGAMFQHEQISKTICTKSKKYSYRMTPFPIVKILIYILIGNTWFKIIRIFSHLCPPDIQLLSGDNQWLVSCLS